KGHVKRECWQLKKNGDSRRKDPESSNTQRNVAHTSDDGEIMYSEAATISKDKQ
ncbi:hypothetical protein PanWU01x14_198920, partial [Parasponia andersonii]